MGFSDLLNRVVKDPKERSHVTAISSSGRGLLTIINDILDLSKIEAGRLELHYEPVSLQQLLTEVAHVFSQKTEEKGLVLEIKLAQLLPGGLFLDPVRLRQILFNVVGNAVKFTDKGVIRLSAASKVSESDTTKVDLILTVSDSGIGIPAGELDRIFDMFTQVSGQNTRSYGGTGLGLSITKRLTEMLGGTLRVESEVGRGSTFYFDFPGVRVVESPILPNENERPALNLDQFRPSTILIAEDHSLNWKLLWAYFDGSKHHLIMATNGREAIEVARKERPDLILMDIRMPEMDGWETLSVLKHDPALKTIPVIMISASISGDETGRNRGLYDAFLRKPVMMADLVQTMALFLPRTKPSTAPEGEMGKPESGLDSGLTNGRPVSPELISLIDAQLAEVWPRLCDRPNIAQIKKFAMRLEQWASTYGVESLLLFAQSLHQQADQFDLEHLFQTLRRFPDIRESLISPGFKT